MFQLLVVALVCHLAAASTINCNGNCDCSSSPAGEPCILNCNGKDVCKDSVLQCGSGRECTVNCVGVDSCGGNAKIYGQDSTHFSLNCHGSDACKGNTVINCGSESCSVSCTASTSCEEATINALSTKQFECLGSCLGVAAPPPFAMPTPKPTPSPVPSPTQQPTQVPTAVPSARPTTQTPTSTPSVRPTQAAPTAAPTMPPTTRTPTFAPTPTTNPTQSPIVRSTQNGQNPNGQQLETIVVLTTTALTTTTDRDASTEAPLVVESAPPSAAAKRTSASTYNALMISGLVIIAVSMLGCIVYFLHSKKRYLWFAGMRKNKPANDIEMQRMHMHPVSSLSKWNARSMAVTSMAVTSMALRVAMDSDSSDAGESAPTTDGVRRELTVPRKLELIDSNYFCSVFSDVARQAQVNADLDCEVDGIVRPDIAHTNMLELQCEADHEPKSTKQNDSDSDCGTKLSSCTKSTAASRSMVEGAEAALPNSTNAAVAYAQAEAVCGVGPMPSFVAPKKSTYMALPQHAYNYPALPVGNDLCQQTGSGYYYQHVAMARPFIDDHRGSTTTLNSLPRDSAKRMPHTFDEEHVETDIINDEDEIAVQSMLLLNTGR